MLGGGWYIKRWCKCQTAAEMSGLQVYEGVESESSRVAVWKTDETVAVVEARQTVAHGAQLFSNRAMADDHTRDGCRMVRTNKETTWGWCNVGGHRRCEGWQTICGDTKVADTAGMM
jgi:hypothetical protein